MNSPAHMKARLEVDPLVVEVAVGGVCVASHPQSLTTLALGSCVGVALWDEGRGCGAMAHVMLPCASQTTPDRESARFASWAVPELVRMLVESGSDPRSLCAKIAGGAAMFRSNSTTTPVGQRNVAEVRHQLEVAGIPLCAEDTGGGHARTIELHLDSGVLSVRSYRLGLRHL